MTAKEISEKIFYSPATNGKAAVSIAFGEQMIKEYGRKLLKEVSERARLKFHDGHFKEDKFMQHIQIGANNVTVDKQSITETPLK